MTQRTKHPFNLSHVHTHKNGKFSNNCQNKGLKLNKKTCTWLSAHLSIKYVNERFASSNLRWMHNCLLIKLCTYERQYKI